MKRTEMLNLMAFRIRDIRKYYCFEMDVAVELLDEMEKAGMLPPTVMLSSTGEFMPTKELLDEANIDYELAWEE